MRIKRSTRFDLCKKIFTRTMVIARTWIRKEVVFYSRIQTTRRMGQSRRIGDDKIRRKQTHRLPIHKSIDCLDECSKAKVVENYQYTFAHEGTIETVFRTTISGNQLSIYGAVSNVCEVCKTCHVRTGRLVFGRTI